MRFHSLPESKRYAETESEYVQVARRHLAVLDDLAGGVTSELLVVAHSWSEDDQPHSPDAEVASLISTQYWGRVPADPRDPQSWFTHFHLGSLKLADPNLALLLLLVADEEASVVIFNASLSWLYAPYDGGADVIARDLAQRDQLRERYQDWLSRRPSGL